MRIISKFHDYYDTAMGLGTEFSKVYCRVLTQLDERLPLDRRRSTLFVETGIPTIHEEHNAGADSATMDSFLVLFAGKLYPGLKVKRMLSEAQYFYNIDSLVTYLAANRMGYFIRETPNRYHRARTKSDNIKDHLELRGSEILLGYAIDSKIVVALEEYKPNNRSGRILTVNPNLSDIQFQKVFSPYEAFQELSMWIGGVLTEPDLPTLMTDKQKIISHGFDINKSFRKDKK